MAKNQEDPSTPVASAMERFSVDESGYTGADLLNEDQRFQGASAISITDEEAKRLIKEHFPKLQAPELKYSSIARRANYREPLLRFLKDVLTHHKAVTYIIDKRYLLMLMFLDNAAEPFYYARGRNFYEDGQNYTLASLIYTTGPTFLGKNIFHGIMAAFQRAMKERTKEAITDLIVRVRKSKGPKKFPLAFGPIANACPECVEEIASPSGSTDAAMVLLLGLVNRMEVMSVGPYRVEHDRSKNLVQYGTILQRFIDHDEAKELKMTEIASLKFPLKLLEVTQVNSEDSPAVQVVDVLVGSPWPTVRIVGRPFSLPARRATRIGAISSPSQP